MIRNKHTNTHTHTKIIGLDNLSEHRKSRFLNLLSCHNFYILDNKLLMKGRKSLAGGFFTPQFFLMLKGQMLNSSFCWPASSIE